jgi:hypothetical protein
MSKCARGVTNGVHNIAFRVHQRTWRDYYKSILIVANGFNKNVLTTINIYIAVTNANTNGLITLIMLIQLGS